MHDRLAVGTITAMTRTVSSSKLLLVADRRSAVPETNAAVRRYRLARLHLGGRPSGATSRIELTKRG